eukprot:612634-Pleurochrysis_carterae.AAC.1
MLTRFVTAIPTKTRSAEETLTALMEHVFTKYSFPVVIKSDNKTALRNELMAYFAKYAGFRNLYVVLMYYLTTLKQMVWQNRVLDVSHVSWWSILSSLPIGRLHYRWSRSH